MTQLMARARYDYAFRDNVGEFVNRVGKIPNLSHEDEVACIAAWQERGDARALETLVAAHQKFIVKTFRRSLGPRAFEDALQTANEAFIRCIKDFDTGRGFRLATYAGWWIKAAVQGMQGHQMVNVNTTANRKRALHNLTRVLADITHGARTPTYGDLKKASDLLGVSFQDVTQIHTYLSRGDLALDAPLQREGEEADLTHLELMVDPSDSPEDVIIAMDEAAKAKARLQQALLILEGREKEVFFARRLQEPPSTLEDLGKIFNISRERVRQVEVRAFEKVCEEMQKIQERAQENARFERFKLSLMKPVRLTP